MSINSDLVNPYRKPKELERFLQGIIGKRIEKVFYPTWFNSKKNEYDDPWEVGAGLGDSIGTGIDFYFADGFTTCVYNAWFEDLLSGLVARRGYMYHWAHELDKHPQFETGVSCIAIERTEYPRWQKYIMVPIVRIEVFWSIQGLRDEISVDGNRLVHFGFGEGYVHHIYPQEIQIHFTSGDSVLLSSIEVLNNKPYLPCNGELLVVFEKQVMEQFQLGPFDSPKNGRYRLSELSDLL